MKRVVVAVAVLLAVGWQARAQTGVSASLAKELEAAEAKMFAGITAQDPEYMSKSVAEDYFSINADGSTVNKTQLMAMKGTPQQKMMAAATYKLFDKQIRSQGNVGIINGRARAYMGEQYLVEFLYTAVFVKKDGVWQFTLWQGTMSKDSPKPPPMPAG